MGGTALVSRVLRRRWRYRACVFVVRRYLGYLTTTTRPLRNSACILAIRHYVWCLNCSDSTPERLRLGLAPRGAPRRIVVANLSMPFLLTTPVTVRPNPAPVNGLVLVNRARRDFHHGHGFRPWRSRSA